MQIDQTLIFSSFVVFGVVTGGSAWALWALSKRRVVHPRSATMTKLLARNFHQRVQHFIHQVQTLDEHANEYTSIFRSAEWGALVETVSRLDRADSQIQQLIKAKKFDEALTILQEAHRSGTENLDDLQASLESYKTSATWEMAVHRMLKSVVLNLEAATHETKELRRTVTSRRRQPTLMTLADVKKTLLEDEVVRRHSSEHFKV